MEYLGKKRSRREEGRSFMDGFHQNDEAHSEVSGDITQDTTGEKAEHRNVIQFWY